ncbi:MAG: O-antigen ligase family protein [Eubacterium sp.]|nr:O-antigen ligase family protein [Eubacterium sp.]
MEPNIINSKFNNTSLLSRISNIIKDVLDYLIVFIIAVTTGCGWVYDYNLDLTNADLYTYLQNMLIVCVIVRLVSFDKLNSSKKYIGRAIVAILIIVTYSFYNTVRVENFNKGQLYIFLWMLLWILLHDDKRTIWNKYVNVVVFLAVMSLFFYVFGSILNIIPEYNSAKRIWGEWKPDIIRNFYYFYYESHYVRIGSTILWRNVGCFAEGPMFNFALCSAFGAEMFIVHNERTGNRKIDSHTLKRTVLIVAILSTLSTTGLIFLCVVGAICTIRNADRFRVTRFLKRHLKLFVTIVFALLVVAVLSKLLSSNGRGSLNVRTDHLFASLEAFLRKPIMGCGWDNSKYIYKFMEHKQGLSVGLPSFLAYGGLLLSSIIFIPIMQDICELEAEKKNHSVRSEEKNNNNIVSFLTHQNKVIFELLFLLIFFFTMVNAYPIVWFFIAYITVDDSAEKVNID